MLPPKRVCSPAPIVPITLRERTVTPRTSPRLRATRHPGSSKAVVTNVGAITMHLSLDEVARHSPTAVLLLHRRHGLDGRFLVFEDGLELDHNVLAVGSSGQTRGITRRGELAR